MLYIIVKRLLCVVGNLDIYFYLNAFSVNSGVEEVAEAPARAATPVCYQLYKLLYVMYVPFKR